MNLFLYLGLLLLTAIAFAAAHLPSLVMGLAGIKFLLVGLYFMDLRRAHVTWRPGFIGFLALFLTLFSAVS